MSFSRSIAQGSAVNGGSAAFSSNTSTNSWVKARIAARNHTENAQPIMRGQRENMRLFLLPQQNNTSSNKIARRSDIRNIRLQAVTASLQDIESIINNSSNSSSKENIDPTSYAEH